MAARITTLRCPYSDNSSYQVSLTKVRRPHVDVGINVFVKLMNVAIKVVEELDLKRQAEYIAAVEAWDAQDPYGIEALKALQITLRMHESPQPDNGKGGKRGARQVVQSTRSSSIES